MIGPNGLEAWVSGDTIRALVERMVPRDEVVSGWEAGVGEFLARIFQSEMASQASTFAAGLTDLEAEASERFGLPFAQMTGPDGEDLLRDLESGRTTHAWSTNPVEFVRLASALCAQGYYGDPGNGGNRHRVSWRSLGYNELSPGRSWPAAEAAPGPVTPPADLRPHYDAIVIGSGAGGCVAAFVLSDAGMSVLLVERGEAQSSDDLPLDHLRSERSATGYPTRTGTSPGGDPRVVEEPEGPRLVFPPDPRWSANATSVGGGTRVYGAQAWRFGPEDFRMASRYGRPHGSSLADWPITYDDLEPWYDLAERELGVAGSPEGAAFSGPRSRPFPMPPVADTLGAQVLRRGAESLGLATSTVPLLINSTPYNGRPACARCGACVGFACHAAAKNGSFNTVLPRALATGRCDLSTRTHATRIVVGPGGDVTGVDLIIEADSGQPQHRTITADHVVVAAGAIETARLLLNSASTDEPNGLGNGHDQVGRNLQSHLYAGAIGFFDEVVQDSFGPGPGIATSDFRHDNGSVIGGGMIANDFVPTPINVWETLTGLGVINAFGATSKAAMRHLWPRMQMVFGPAQEVPNPESRVRVDSEVLDRFGTPAARLSGDIHPEDRRTARLLAQHAEDWLLASGATSTIRMDADDRPPGPSGGQHQAGTCRMGDDPETSVTDRWGRLWGHSNVLLADGSIHVTNGGVNPVLTIFALAFRNSTRLVDEWRSSVPG